MKHQPPPSQAPFRAHFAKRRPHKPPQSAIIAAARRLLEAVRHGGVWPCRLRESRMVGVKPSLRDRAVAIACLLSFCGCLSPLRGKLIAAEIPTFRLRLRLGAPQGGPTNLPKFGISYVGPSETYWISPGEWSPDLTFGQEQVKALMGGHYAISAPAVVKLQVRGVADLGKIVPLEAELRFDEGGQPVRLTGELFGDYFGILVWRDQDRKPRATTMAEYNQRYWRAVAGVEVSPPERPKNLLIIDRFGGGGDFELGEWREGIQQLSRFGFDGLFLEPSRPLRHELLKTGLRRYSWGVYNPPGGYFDYDPGKARPAMVEKWAEDIAKSYSDAGYSPGDMELFALADEPGWDYPQTLVQLAASAEGLARFRDYLREQALQPGDLGAEKWDDVMPMGRSLSTVALKHNSGLQASRLFYWTMRFLSWDSSRYFANVTKALEKAYYPGVPIFVNWNFFSGRFYTPGPDPNNPDKLSPDSGLGTHDWFEFGRMRGSTFLWTEDWFPDSMAYQWSFYCAKLRCSSRKGGVHFGGYIVVRAGGDRESGLLQKALTIIGSGGKAIDYWTFGPEYGFPGNCYSEHPEMLRKIAEANRMLGAADDLLWAGERPQPQVAILAPRSSEVWELQHQALPTAIRDSTNTNLNARTVDYMAEVFDLYLALQHANIPVDFVDEDDLTGEGLRPYRVLYVTEPDIPVEGQQGIAGWVRDGGTLVSVSGAGSRDRYDQPSGTLSELEGIDERPRQRVLVPELGGLTVAGTVSAGNDQLSAIGVRGYLTKWQGTVQATFSDTTPAIVGHAVGKGRVVHFAWMPGLSYARSSRGTKDRLPVDYSITLRRMIVAPTEAAGVRIPVKVDTDMVETPMLLSPGGAAITLLNWTGDPLKHLTVEVRDLPFAVKTVASIKWGSLEVHKQSGAYLCSLPLDAADIITLRP